MKILSWNCRGLGQSSTVLALKELVRKYRPDVVFLMETLVHIQKIEEIKIGIGFEGCLAVDRIGRSGGLACLWRKSEEVRVMNYSNNHVDVCIHYGMEDEWRFTGYYGFPERQRRRDSWNLIRRLARTENQRWVIMGDFNDMLASFEKFGGREHPSSLLEGFRNCIADANLSELVMSGGTFTWEKSRGLPNAMFEKLDRAFANPSWLSKFPVHNVLNLVASVSDNNPILLQIGEQNLPNKRGRFRFENAWLLEESVHEVVKQSWCLNNHDMILDKILTCTNSLVEWSSKLHLEFKRQNQVLQQKLQAMYRCNVTGYCVQELKLRLNRLLVQEEQYWRQRAKSFWLQHGDVNSKYFHAQASSRKRLNTISVLQTENGELISDEEGKGKIVAEYFENLYSASSGSGFDVYEGMESLITDEDNKKLLEPYTSKEFKIAH